MLSFFIIHIELVLRKSIITQWIGTKSGTQTTGIARIGGSTKRRRADNCFESAQFV